MTNRTRTWSALILLTATSAVAWSCKSDDNGDPDASADGGGGASGLGGDGQSGGDGDGDGDLSEPADVTPASGSRLKQVWLEGGGAARAQNIFDSELDVNCRFETMEDGSLRCAPFNSDPVVFQDDECSQALLPDYEGPCGETPSEFSGIFLRTDDCSPALFRSYRALSSVDTPTMIYRLTDGECVGEAANLDESYFAAEAVDPNEFVEAEIMVAPRSSTLGARYFASTDGGRFFDGAAHLEGERACEPNEEGVNGSGNYFCIADAALRFRAAYGYVDDACTEDAAYAGSCQEPEAVVAFGTNDEGCSIRELLEVGDELESIFESDGMTCTEVAVEDSRPVGARRFAAGSPAEGLVPLSLEVGPSDGELARQLYLSEGEPVDEMVPFWHVGENVRCVEERLPNGDWVCLPGRIVNLGSSIDSGIFADAECTREVVYGGNPAPCEDAATFSFIVEQAENFCDPGTIYEAGETFVTNTIYNLAGDACEPQVNEDDGYWVEVGDLADENEFVRLVERVDD